VVAWKKLADSWTDEFMRLDHEADFWEKLQKQWDDLDGLVLFQLSHVHINAVWKYWKCSRII